MTVKKVTGAWPSEFPVAGDRKVAEGLVVWSKSGDIEGRTTGSRFPCKTIGCPGWQIGVLWESGQQTYICSEGWAYDPATKSVRVTGGGDISARFTVPAPWGVLPFPREEWPDRSELRHRGGWKVGTPGTSGRPST